MADKKSLLTIVFAVTISIIVGAAAVAYGPTLVKNINQESNNTNTTPNQNGNVSSFSGNITNITSFDNGTYVVTVQAPVSQAKDKQYQDNIVASLKKGSGQFSNICTITITTKDNANPRLIYSKPNSIACKHIPPVVPPVVTPPPPVVNNTVPPPVVNNTVPPVINNTSNNTEPNPPVPTPPPQVSNQTAKIIMTGDVESGAAGDAVFQQIKKENATHVVVLGDMGYSTNLKWLKSTYGTLGNKFNCVIGNHDALEDGTAQIYAESKAYCTESYYFKVNHALFIGFNTNGDLNTQAIAAGKLLSNTAFMNGTKSVHIMSHKDCAVPPNSHHPVEATVKTFCDVIKSKIPGGVKPYYDQAHNHVMSSSADGTYKQVGAGGKSHYVCGVSAAFPFCDNVHFGFLEYIIKPDGTTTSQFMDYNGKEIK